MPNLRPFRDYDEKDVINIFSVSGVALPFSKGTLVKITQGLRNDQEQIEMLGNAGDFSVSNTVAQRYGVYPKIGVAGDGDNPIGMTLFDVRETDENGELLKFHPRKAAEMEAILSGQACPLVTRGTFEYIGATGTISAGATAYCGANGVLTTYSGAAALPNVAVGRFLGPTGANSGIYVWLNIGNGRN